MARSPRHINFMTQIQDANAGRNQRTPTYILRYRSFIYAAAAVAVLLSLPFIVPIQSPTGGDIASANLPMFSKGHWLGTDINGNDVAARLYYGGRTSLLLALTVNAIGCAIGGCFGAMSAYFGGMIDTVAMRLLDAMLAIPAIVVILGLASVAKPTFLSVAMALAIFSVPAFARVARTATQALMQEPFMTYAKLYNRGWLKVLIGHVAPNIGGPLATFAILGIASVMTIEGALSYLGFGIPLPSPSWGSMIFQGQHAMSARPALVLLPCACLFLSVLILNVTGQRLRTRLEHR